MVPASVNMLLLYYYSYTFFSAAPPACIYFPYGVFERYMPARMPVCLLHCKPIYQCNVRFSSLLHPFFSSFPIATRKMSPVH